MNESAREKMNTTREVADRSKWENNLREVLTAYPSLADRIIAGTRGMENLDFMLTVEDIKHLLRCKDGQSSEDRIGYAGAWRNIKERFGAESELIRGIEGAFLQTSPKDEPYGTDRSDSKYWWERGDK